MIATIEFLRDHHDVLIAVAKRTAQALTAAGAVVLFGWGCAKAWGGAS